MSTETTSPEEAVLPANIGAWLTTTLDEVEAEARAAQADRPTPWTAKTWDFTPGPSWPVQRLGYVAVDDPGLGGAWWGCCEIDPTSTEATVAVHMAAWAPDVVLASVEADRAILADHVVESWPDGLTSCSRCGPPGACPWPCRTVLLVASRYRHRPGYRGDKWEPGGMQ